MEEENIIFLCVSLFFFLFLDHITHFFSCEAELHSNILIIAADSGSAEFVAVNVTIMYFVLVCICLILIIMLILQS